MSEIIRSIEQAQLRSDLPKINVGDTVRVWVKVVEGSRERLQAFEGNVIAKRNGGIRETFTVRRVSYGIGVERTFPMHSPRVSGSHHASGGWFRNGFQGRFLPAPASTQAQQSSI